MQIKQELPQFSKNSAIIISAGKQHAIIYLAKDSKISKLKEIRVKKDIYSDREGHFARKSSHVDISSGSVYEDVDKEKRLNEFIKKIEKEIKNKDEQQMVYCFCPAYLKNIFKSLLDKYFIKVKLYLGNFTDKHPFILLEKIKNE